MGRIKGDLLRRSFDLALGVLDVADELPRENKGWVVGRQLIKSGTSIGANIREAHRAVSEADFAYKCSIAQKEASETQYWLELAREARLLPGPRVQALLAEVNEISFILAAIGKKTQAHIKGNQ